MFSGPLPSCRVRPLTDVWPHRVWIRLRRLRISTCPRVIMLLSWQTSWPASLGFICTLQKTFRVPPIGIGWKSAFTQCWTNFKPSATRQSRCRRFRNNIKSTNCNSLRLTPDLFGTVSILQWNEVYPAFIRRLHKASVCSAPVRSNRSHFHSLACRMRSITLELKA